MGKYRIIYMNTRPIKWICRKKRVARYFDLPYGSQKESEILKDTATMTLEQLCKDYDRVEKAIQFIEQNIQRQPSLEEIAASVDLNEDHFQRMFSRWGGISPKRFLQYLTKEYAKTLLQRSNNILDTTLDPGLSSPEWLHDLIVTWEAVTPDEFRHKGNGVHIEYGFHPSPFGECLLAATKRGICALIFAQGKNQSQIVRELAQYWPNTQIIHRTQQTRRLVEQAFDVKGNQPQAPLHLYVKGTRFQIKVWEALLRIPLGSVVAYSDIAKHIGLPRAARAVGNAVGKNPIPFLIPCHRVIRKMGEFGYYGSGPARKKAMLGWEVVFAQTKPTEYGQNLIGK